MATATANGHIPEQNSSAVSGSGSGSSSSSSNIFKRLHPEQYLSRYLESGYRPDGRKEREWRGATINAGSISTADGSALVRLGETTMICGIKAEIAEPEMMAPSHGYIIPNIDLPALCSPKFKPGPPGEEAQVYSNWLNDLLTSSGTVPLESLCIAPGKAVWALYIDVVCLNYDGNAFDAAVLAVMAALRDTRLPRATYNDETSRTTCTAGEKFPIALGRVPLSASFGIFASTYLLPDPTSFESPLMPTNITVAFDEDNTACLVRQEGLGGLKGMSGERVISAAWRMAEERVKGLREVLLSTERAH